QKGIVYRVDKHAAVELHESRNLRSLGIRVYEWEPKWVNFRIWHGRLDEGLSTGLVQIMTGQQLVVRYFLGTGGYKDTEFSLTGSSQAISGALGIPANIDPNTQARKQAFRDRLA